MKICILGDMHFNIKNGNKIFQKNIKKFCDLVLFPYLFGHKINVVLQSGDIFDSRTSTHSEGLNNSKECFFDKLKHNNIHLHLILGNHDLFYRESLSINTPELVLAEYNNITIYKDPTTVKFDSITVDFLSWICDENRDKTLNYIAKSKSDYCFAHLELVGFKMSKSYVAEHGDDSKLFSNYKRVWSGHYHTSSKSDNIFYLGNPTQDTWESVDEVKGFYVFDTETREMEFVENSYNLFERLVYNESLDYIRPNITEKYVKLIIQKCTDNKKLEKYIEELWKENPYDIKVIDNIIVNDAVNNEITLEDLSSDSFSMVEFLSDYTIKNNVNLTNIQQEYVNITYKKLFNMKDELV